MQYLCDFFSELEDFFNVFSDIVINHWYFSFRFSHCWPSSCLKCVASGSPLETIFYRPLMAIVTHRVSCEVVF